MDTLNALPTARNAHFTFDLITLVVTTLLCDNNWICASRSDFNGRPSAYRTRQYANLFASSDVWRTNCNLLRTD